MIFAQRGRIIFWGMTSFLFFFVITFMIACFIQKHWGSFSLVSVMKMNFIIGSLGCSIGAICGGLYDRSHDDLGSLDSAHPFQRKKRIKIFIIELLMLICINALSGGILYLTLEFIGAYNIRFL